MTQPFGEMPDDEIPPHLGEEIQILTLNEQRHARLLHWSHVLKLPAEEILLRSFDLFARRLAVTPDDQITTTNPKLFQP